MFQYVRLDQENGRSTICEHHREGKYTYVDVVPQLAS
jgi:hypothetical protein